VNTAQHPHSNESNKLVVVIVPQPRNAGQVFATLLHFVSLQK